MEIFATSRLSIRALGFILFQPNQDSAMGDHADDAMLRGLDAMLAGEEDDEDFWVPFKSCRYCGVSPLWWGKDELGRFRLYDGEGKLHKCDKYKRNG